MHKGNEKATQDRWHETNRANTYGKRRYLPVSLVSILRQYPLYLVPPWKASSKSRFFFLRYLRIFDHVSIHVKHLLRIYIYIYIYIWIFKLIYMYIYSIDIIYYNIFYYNNYILINNVDIYLSIFYWYIFYWYISIWNIYVIINLCLLKLLLFPKNMCFSMLLWCWMSFPLPGKFSLFSNIVS
jgi:hypothetical protein